MEQAIACWEKIGNLAELADSLNELGSCHQAQGHHELALQTFERCASALERVNVRTLGEQSRASFFARWGELPARVSHTVAALADDKKARAVSRGFPMVDGFFARRLLEGLQERSEGVLAAADPELAAQYSQTLDHMVELRLKLEKLSEPDENLARLKNELGKEQEKLAGIEHTLRDKNPRLAHLVAPKTASLEDAQRVLGPDAALIEYVLGEDRSFAWVVTAKEATLVTLPGEPEIRKSYDALSSLLARRLLSLQFAAPARELYEKLLGPVLDHCKDKQELVIVPDGFLGFLPFEVLLTSEVKPDEEDLSRLPYLVRDRAVRYVPSASFLVWLSEQKPSAGHWSKDLLLLGDPLYAGEQTTTSKDLLAMRAKGELSPERWQRLKGTRDEVKAIAEPLVARGEADVLFALRDLPRSGHVSASRFELCVGEEASVARLKQDLRGYRILHLAVHGFFDTQWPWFSGLVLSETQGGKEAYVNTLELATLSLDAEIVFLSACETAKGEALRCEGIKSVARSFLIAGARSVVATQWAVADLAAPVLASTFYEKLLGGLDPARALREAKLALIDQHALARGAQALADRSESTRTRFAHPAYWAGFVLWGR